LVSPSIRLTKNLYHEMICKTIVTSYKFPKTSKLELETRPTITAIALPLKPRGVELSPLS